jgi:large subunit ribosomal protein L3
MLKGLIGKKIGMTQIFDDGGSAVPVTIIEAGPCYVTQVRTVGNDGYAAIQLGFMEANPKRLTGGELGHLKRNDLPPLRFLREFSAKDADLETGAKVTVDIFELGDMVDVTGTSKGKGFAGVVKRHGFAGGPKTHGQSDRTRAPGARSSGSDLSRVFKGSRSAGQMGNRQVTVQGLKVVLVDPERNILGVRGAVPGPKGALVLINGARKARK